MKELKVHKCSDGGLLYEFVRDERFGQLAIRTVPPGVTAGGHRHPETDEWWLVIRGEAALFLEYPNGIREVKRVSGERPQIVPIPAGTGHDIKNVGSDDVMFIFWASRLYDPKTHDKEPWSWD